MRERVNQLKGAVRRVFEVSKASATDATKLVDTLQHFGVEHYFREEIDAALSRIRDEEPMFASSNNLHIIALRFRLLRQHGIWVSADVFDKFRDGTGDFSMSLCNSPRGLLSLYNAAHMATPEETALDDAIAFTRRHLEAMKSKLMSPLVKQVARALDIPLPRIGRRLETRHYIAEYELEEEHDPTLLELARLDFELVRLLHLKELSELCLWHESAASMVPGYLRTLYLRTLKGFQDFEDMLDPSEKYRICYVKRGYKMIIEIYFKEATWLHQGYVPSFKEHVEFTRVSSGLPMLIPVLLMGLGSVPTYKETFEWALNMPDMVLASGEVGRFLNDLTSYKVGKRKKDVASTLECYMEEHDATGEEAFAAVTRMKELAWRRINRACLEMDPALLRPAQFAVVDLARLIILHIQIQLHKSPPPPGTTSRRGKTIGDNSD
nr:unnamed protein product [Digitaria exilis]